MIIDELLREAKMSRYKLSKTSGVAQATILDICSGKTSMEKCSAGTLYKIAKALNVTVDALLEADEQEKIQNLVAMKLMAGRQYKNDLSDVVGILLEQQNAEKGISLDSIKRAAGELYDGYENLPEISRTFIEAVYQNPDLSALYDKIREDEKQNKDILLEFQDDYPDVLNGDNLADILKAVKARENNK